MTLVSGTARHVAIVALLAQHQQTIPADSLCTQRPIRSRLYAHASLQRKELGITSLQSTPFLAFLIGPCMDTVASQ